MNSQIPDHNPQFTKQWLKQLDQVLQAEGKDRVQFLVNQMIKHSWWRGVELPCAANTPYINTISIDNQPAYPGDRELERRIKSLIRWNAMAMVVRANRHHSGIGGHISSYASSATLFEVGFNHFFRGHDHPEGRDIVFFQGHAAPGIYSRAFLEGRLTREDLENFRRELTCRNSLSSYPHPWLMPSFWETTGVNMGFSPILSIYQARFNRYLHNRKIKDTSGDRVWAFMGDGEMDEPESLGAITLASREQLDNLIFVVNCNMQKLDGPVRGNGKIIQELEAAFRGAGWQVIKVVWGGDWDPLLSADTDGILQHRMAEVVDGQYQKYSVAHGDYIRKDFFGTDDRLLKMVETYSDQQLERMRRGGHDPEKVYAAYERAVQHTGAPTVILAKTVKGYGLGEAGEGRNISHQQKKLNEEELRKFRDRFNIPLSDDEIADAPIFMPDENSEEIQYLRESRRRLGGFVPERRTSYHPLPAPPVDDYTKFFKSSGDRTVATTQLFVQFLSHLMRDKQLGKRVVPIVPDEARTFGLDGLFRQYGIYACKGQLYEPVDYPGLLYYREAVDGQILEEGITEAGSMSSFIAAATSYSQHGEPMIPFFIFYSMFGFQRVADLIWANSDHRGRGFLLGATAGRTTLNGEGLQHQDGQSHVIAETNPAIMAYDPAYGYEMVTIILEGIRQMYLMGEDKTYYLTLYNEQYPMPALPENPDIKSKILKGLYKLRPTPNPAQQPARVHLFGSGSLLSEALRAQEILADQFGVGADVWSVTSWSQLRRDGLACDRWNMLHPDQPQHTPYLMECLQNEPLPVIAVSDYMKLLSDMVVRWTPAGLYPLGTDGFGRSDTRKQLRRHFEIDAESIAMAALYVLAQRDQYPKDQLPQALQKLGIDPMKHDPALA